VNKGVIDHCKIYGDFFGVGEVIDIEVRLKNVKYERASLDKALEDLDIKHYFGNITKEDFIQLIY
jgi:lipoate-protein ligase A